MRHPVFIEYEMQNGLVVEICVESAEHAAAAERGGADRVELCTDLLSGGITPSSALMVHTRRAVNLPIHALIRPRSGDFCYYDREFASMQDDIAVAKQMGMDGIVLGVLNRDGEVDVERTGQLVELAHPLPVTFHRAFDYCRDMGPALESVIKAGATRLLTAGGTGRVTDGLATLQALVKAAGNRIIIMPGGGIGAHNVQKILRLTTVREIHTSVGMSNARANHRPIAAAKANGNETTYLEFEQRVRRIRRLLNVTAISS